MSNKWEEFPRPRKRGQGDERVGALQPRSNQHVQRHEVQTSVIYLGVGDSDVAGAWVDGTSGEP